MDMIVKTYRYAVSENNPNRCVPIYSFQEKVRAIRNGYRHIVYTDPVCKLIESYGQGEIPKGIGIVYKTFILSNKPMEKKNTYALYRGDELLSIGTLEKIAKDMNVSKKTVLHYGTPAWKNRKEANWETSRVLIKVEDDDEEDI